MKTIRFHEDCSMEDVSLLSFSDTKLMEKKTICFVEDIKYIQSQKNIDLHDPISLNSKISEL